MVFPKWTNLLPGIGVTALAGLAVFIVFAFWYWSTDKHLSVGYEPRQPILYSHKQHIINFGMDCRFCHFNVERSSFAGVPPTQVCMNCHGLILPESPQIIKLKKYHEADLPVPWVRVHKVPDYAYFDHSAHVNKGVGCVDCHGRIDQMTTVRQSQSLTMSWCLDCHLAPHKSLRDRKLMTASAWAPKGDPREIGIKFEQEYHVNTRIDCSACHR